MNEMSRTQRKTEWRAASQGLKPLCLPCAHGLPLRILIKNHPVDFS